MIPKAAVAVILQQSVVSCSFFARFWLVQSLFMDRNALMIREYPYFSDGQL